MDTKLLDKVRREVLIMAALNDGKYTTGFGLSRMEMIVGGKRGHIQRCLSLLAKEGIMYERQHAEPCVASYEHCETDKRFRVRISREDAIQKLEELGVKNYIPKEEFII